MISENIKIGCKLFVLHNNAILLGKRINCYGDGSWGLPGGHLEVGETLVECARRELKEELEIEAISLSPIIITDNFGHRGQYVHVSFLVKEFSGNIKNMEPQFCSEWHFFKPEQIPPNVFVPHCKILKAYLSNSLYLEEK